MAALPQRCVIDWWNRSWALNTHSFPRVFPSLVIEKVWRECVRARLCSLYSCLPVLEKNERYLLDSGLNWSIKYIFIPFYVILKMVCFKILWKHILTVCYMRAILKCTRHEKQGHCTSRGVDSAQSNTVLRLSVVTLLTLVVIALILVLTSCGKGSQLQCSSLLFPVVFYNDRHLHWFRICLSLKKKDWTDLKKCITLYNEQ